MSTAKRWRRRLWTAPSVVLLLIAPASGAGAQEERSGSALDTLAAAGRLQSPPAAEGGEASAAGVALLGEDEPFGHRTAQGSYEVRSLSNDSLLGREDWELYEDEAGFRTIRSTLALTADGLETSRRASVTVTPELAFVEADVGASGAGGEAYASFRREGDLLTVEAFGAAGGETRQQVRFPAEGVFVSQLFATRGWELAPFEGAGDGARAAYLAGSAPGVLVGEVRTLRAESLGREVVDVDAGRFRVLLLEVAAAEAAGEEDGEELDRWWVLAGSRLPAAAELPSLGVRVELVAFDQIPAGETELGPGAVLARGVYHHRPLRNTDPLAVETWSLAAAAGGGYSLRSEISYADGRSVAVRALADSLFQVRELTMRRRKGRQGETLSWRSRDGEVTAEARGGGVGLATQRVLAQPPVAFRLEVAALEGWAVRAGADSGGSTYWLPAGAHPLGTLLDVPSDVAIGEERLPTPARTFSTRRYA
ncbi:MAG: hypothetical protein ABR599_05715, partial [Gemmatimonadota bacterium]